MAVTLNREGFEYAQGLINDRRVVLDGRDAWSEDQPSADDENRFIEKHGWTEYGKWHLGIADEAKPETKARYEFPYGDFEKVHRCAILSAESRAGQYDHEDIENAASHLYDMLETVAAR